MTPREVYVTRLPGHTGPVLVRKRPPQQPRRKFSLLAEAFGQPQRYYTAKRVPISAGPPGAADVMDVPSRLEVEQVRPDYPVMVTRRTEPGTVLVQASRNPEPAFAEIVPPERTTYVTRRPRRITKPTMRHTCASCGKFRSSSYEHRHPLALGEVPKPTMCGKCVRKQTSSEESADSHGEPHQKIKYYRLRRRWTASTGDRISEFERGRPRHLASKQGKRHYSRQSSSDKEPRVSITYDGARSRKGTSEYSPGGPRVRVVRRIRYVDSQRRPLSRSRSRSSSRSVNRRHYNQGNGYEASSSEESPVRVRVQRVPYRSRSRSVTYRRPLQSVRSPNNSSFGDDYEYVYSPNELRRPQHVERAIEVEDDRATVKSGGRRQSASTIVEPGTTYAATRAGDFDLESHYDDGPVEIRSLHDRVERQPSRSVRIVQVSPDTQDSFRRRRISESVEPQRIICEPRPPPIIRRQIVEPAVHTVTETTIVEPKAAPATETHIIDRREHSPTPSSGTHFVERRGRSPAPATERHIVERRFCSPSRVYERHVETRSRSRPRPDVSEREYRETRTQSPSSMSERHSMESGEPSRHEQRRRVKIAGRNRLPDSSDESLPPGMFCSYNSSLGSANQYKNTITVVAREELQAPVLPCAALSQ